jgi:hypothetical protein
MLFVLSLALEGPTSQTSWCDDGWPGRPGPLLGKVLARPGDLATHARRHRTSRVHDGAKRGTKSHLVQTSRRAGQARRREAWGAREESGSPAHIRGCRAMVEGLLGSSCMCATTQGQSRFPASLPQYSLSIPHALPCQSVGSGRPLLPPPALHRKQFHMGGFFFCYKDNFWGEGPGWPMTADHRVQKTFPGLL